MTSVDCRRIRLSLSLSQRSMAGLLGVTAQSVYYYECGHTTPSAPVQKLYRLAERKRI